MLGTILYEPEIKYIKTSVVKAERAVHRGENRILLKFEYNKMLINLMKQVESCRWSETLRCWHIEDNPFIIEQLYDVLRNNATLFFTNQSEKENRILRKSQPENYSYFKLDKDKIDSLNKFKYWLKNRRYSEKTIITYIECMKSFFSFYPEKPLHEISNDDIIMYNNKYILANRYSSSYQNQVVSAIKLYYLRIENKRINVEEIQRPKRPRRLPDILSKEEVETILKTPVNLKHRIMLSLIYACGLRRSELLNLTPGSIDYDRKLLIIKAAKGNKDRVAPLPVKINEILKEYIEKYKPGKWLFEGYNKDEKYSETSLQEVFKNSLEKSGIKKTVTLHSLRHSYATHLLENGTDLRYIQEILGHKSSKTTEIYTHVTSRNIERIKSPFDDLDL